MDQAKYRKSEIDGKKRGGKSMGSIKLRKP